jgi:predicted PurR-regulated permease PerM
MNGSAQASRHFFVVLTTVVLIAALRLGQDVLIPLALSVLMTFLLAPLVDRLQRWGINRHLAVLATVLVAFAIVAGLFYVVFDQLRDLSHQLPQYRRQLAHNVESLSGVLKGGVSRATKTFEDVAAELRKVAPAESSRSIPKVQVVEPPLDGIQALRQLFGPLVGPISTAAIVVVFVIFMLLRFADLRDRLIRLMGPRHLRLVTEAIDDAGRRVSRYLVMQTLINSWEGLCIAVGLSFIGVPNAVLWGVMTGLLRFIPYVGIWIAAAMPLLLSFAVFDHWTPPLLTLALFAGVELVSYLILEPWLYSSGTGISPVALLVAAAFWAWLWGAAGLFLAIPLTVCLVVMGKYIPQLAWLHVLLGDQPVLGLHEQLYQRLLAGNAEEADEILESALRQQSLMAVCDSIVLPALQLSERDHHQGALREAKRRSVLDHLEHWSDEVIHSRAARLPGGLPPPGWDAACVLCLPTTDRADQIAAKLLALVLVEQGVPARALSRAEARELEVSSAATAIVISALALDATMQARHLCRRTRTQFADCPIVVGFWHVAGEPQKSGLRLTAAGATEVVTTFEAAGVHLSARTADYASTPSSAAEKPPAPSALTADSEAARIHV